MYCIIILDRGVGKGGGVGVVVRGVQTLLTLGLGGFKVKI